MLLALEIFGLRDAIEVQWLVPGDSGLWDLETPRDGKLTMKDVYTKGDPDYKGRFTAPVLQDNKTGAIVCNESIDIVRMIAVEFAGQVEDEGDRALCEKIQSDINNGVYKCGFAKTQQAYDVSCPPLPTSRAM